MNKKIIYILCALSILQSVHISDAVSSSVRNQEQQEPMLIYHIFAPSFGQHLGESNDFQWIDNGIAYLPIIHLMGFNAVWLSPFFKTGQVMTSRNHEIASDNDVPCSNCMYAAYDFSRIEGESCEGSTGDPSYFSPIVIEKLSKFNATAKQLCMKSLFDFDIGMVNETSPLVPGSFSSFKAKGVDTSKWFREDTGYWYGGAGSGDKALYYKDPLVAQEIVEYLWKPLIYKMHSIGFDGVRFDFAAQLPVNLQDECINYMKYLNPKAIVFAEVLGQTPKTTSYTHITNDTIFVNSQHIQHGDLGWINNQIRDKSNTCQNTCPDFRRGTIGFPGSHDEGNTLHVINKELHGGGWNNIFNHLNRMSLAEKLRLSKLKIATVAFASDAGYYLLSGDEYMSSVKKCVYLNTGGKIRNQDEQNMFNKNFVPSPEVKELQSFITSVNNTFRRLRPAKGNYRFDIFFYPRDDDQKALVFVRHMINSRGSAADIVFVDLTQQNGRASRLFEPDAIASFLSQKNALNPNRYTRMHDMLNRKAYKYLH